MEPLNRVISYWRDCIHHEDVLGQGISPLARKKSALSPFRSDPFIFAERQMGIRVSGGDLSEFLVYASVQGLDCYFGYPLLLSKNKDGKAQVAPLFVMKLSLVRGPDGFRLTPEESRPTCGIQACQQLGLRTEEIATLTNSIEKLFDSRESPRELLSKAIALVEEEAKLLIHESLDPSSIGQTKMSPSGPGGIYNQSVLFAGESSGYNLQLLNDLKELAGRKDLEKTALSFILAKTELVDGQDIVPVLPFPANERQVAALQQVFANKLTVVTGPPGTGKSQFISNLIVNLFLQGKTSLFVSHTNEAVDVVNGQLNRHFPNMMLRTGNKEMRQELSGRLNLLLQASGKSFKSSIDKSEIEEEWKRLMQRRGLLLHIVTKEAQAERAERNLTEFRSLFGDSELSGKLRELLPKLPAIVKLFGRLNAITSKIDGAKYNPWERLVLFFVPQYFSRRRDELFGRMSQELGPEILSLLRRRTGAQSIEGVDDPAWPRIQEMLSAVSLQKEIEAHHRWLESQPSKISVQEAIRAGETKYTQSSIEYLRGSYQFLILGQSRAFGKVFSFVNSVSGTQPLERTVPSHLFRDALKTLRVWSCTLKSLRRTFPLDPAVFDFVIFDEASQVDLPGAAPALYRAKQVIIVGDGNQLTHIATLTRDADEKLAKAHGLLELRELYPERVGYRGVSLYKAGKVSLTSAPVLLANHYRSEDQIISLCNRVFYDGQLVVLTALDRARYPAGLPIGLEWLDCKGRVFKPVGGSRINQDEAAQVAALLVKILKQAAGTDIKVGVVTPYSAQRELILRLASRDITPDLFAKHDIKILTAHRFQGSERDIMIFSPVLSALGEGNGDRWFNANPEILNVALSRAKFLLYIVGDKDYCRARPDGVLSKIVKAYDEIKQEERAELLSLGEKFDSPYEERLYQYLSDAGFEAAGYKLIPKLVAKRYTLDFALIGKRRINIECDGGQHEIIGGLPIIEDVERDSFLKSNGWSVVRVPNRRIMTEPEKVVAEIRALCNATT